MFDPMIIIYIYIYIIVSLILFDLWYTMNDRFQERRGTKKLKKYKEMISNQIIMMEENSILDKKHVKSLKWNFRKINNLLIYQEAIKELYEKSSKKVDEYLILYAPVFQMMLHTYRKKDSIYKAFLASFLSLYYPFHLNYNSIIDEEIMKYVEDKSIYCRENAMLYFYQRGSATLVVNALRMISDQGSYYNKKLLANDLLKFKGKEEELAQKLFQEFGHFSIDFQVSIINYLRFSKTDLSRELYEMLIKNLYDKEVNLALIRYFGSKKYEKVLPYLLELLTNTNQEDVEYKIIATQALKNYDCEKVRTALIKCISDDNWYVRRNASSSLCQMKLTKIDIKEIEAIEDKYGREMVEYTFLSHKKKGEKKA